tara:strand:+ start:300 stop:746 length:447 start_codon:yes stop_codon:yes gene_type:complete
MTTYTNGLCFKTERKITKNDIIIMCNLLNSNSEYSNLCTFRPEGISEGGIIYDFKDNSQNEWYKTVRLCVNHGNTGGKWDWVNENVMTEWSDNDDIIFYENSIFTTYLKSFNGAPLFTIDEIKIWENCFQQIGIVRSGMYPSKKRLIS